MPAEPLLRGLYVPLVTPFTSSGEVALDAVEQLASEYLDAGATGIVALGSTGEASALDASEKQAVVDTCARVCATRGAQLVVGAGTNNTAATIAAVESLRGTPALTAILVVVPYYVRPPEDGIVAHFEAVAEASPVPLVLYNIPYRTGRVLSAPNVLKLAANRNIAGLKQAVGGLDADTLQILAGAPHDFAVLCGDDAYIYPTMLMGGAGAIAAASHLCTPRFVAMVECGLAGKLDDGRAHAEALLPVVQAGFSEPNPCVFKAALHAQGRIPSPDVRLPLINASASALRRALDAVDAASLH